MNPNNFKVMKLDGTTYDLEELGVIVKRFIVVSPTPINRMEQIEGRDGLVDLDTTYDSRKIKAECTMIAADSSDYVVKRDELFRLFDSRESFYILPDENTLRRFQVKCDSPFSLSRQGNVGDFDLEFISPSVYAESTTTTLELNSASNTKSTTTFTISNPGDKVIDPREDYLVISYTGASTNLKIKNNTNGDEWQYIGSSAAGDTLKLDGIRSLKNNLSIFGNTNRKLIKLEKGNNSFTLTGTSGAFSISFDFRYKYL